MVFKEVDDRLWAKIEPILPDQKPKTGRPRADLRKTFNGILYVVKTGITWSDVPRMYGAKSTVHRLHLELCKSGAYQKINQILTSEGYLSGKIDLSCCKTEEEVSRAIFPLTLEILKRKRGIAPENLIRIFINRDMLLRDSPVGLKVLKRSLQDMKDWRILIVALLLCHVILCCGRFWDKLYY